MAMHGWNWMTAQSLKPTLLNILSPTLFRPSWNCYKRFRDQAIQHQAESTPDQVARLKIPDNRFQFLRRPAPVEDFCHVANDGFKRLSVLNAPRNDHSVALALVIAMPGDLFRLTGRSRSTYNQRLPASSDVTRNSRHDFQHSD